VRKEYYWSTAWTQNGEVRYIYDGMRVIQERDSSNTPTVVYTRGRDLSDSLQGAGGIGGLLGRSHGYSSGTWSTHNHYHADGNGNITYLVNSGQTAEATYTYDPYGRTMAQSGGLATANVYRFSSKEIHAKSGMYYYGFRFYEPHLQRWPNQDPLGDQGSLIRLVTRYASMTRHSPSIMFPPGTFELWGRPNLYAFVQDDPVNQYDPLGLFSNEELRMMIQALSEAMERLPVGSPEWRSAYAARARLYAQLAARAAALRAGVCVAAGAAGYGAGRYVGTREVMPGTGVTVDDGVQELFKPFWDWWYGGQESPK
jgi:RHS repeat-associated protein